MSKRYMVNFREARKEMGFIHTSVYIPSNKQVEHSIYVDKLKANHMLTLCRKELPTSRARRSLAARNLCNLPEKAEVTALEARLKPNKEEGEYFSALFTYMNDAVLFYNLSQKAETEEEELKYLSQAVANNHMAAALWREINFYLNPEEYSDGKS